MPKKQLKEESSDEEDESINLKGKKIIDFILTDIAKYNTLAKLLNSCNSSIEKGFVFEGLWNLIMLFGMHPSFPTNEYDFMAGNGNTNKIAPTKSIKKYVQENLTISGKKTGYSDITLKNKQTNKYIFFSSKYLITNKKTESVDSYGIQEIITMIAENKDLYRNYEIYILVENKEAVLKKVTNANKSSKPITKYLTKDKLFDQDDLAKLYVKLRDVLIRTKLSDYDKVFLKTKYTLKFPFHQRLIIKKVKNLKYSNNKLILIGAKPRSGKTYIVGGLITSLATNSKSFNALVITPAPTETIPQFTDDLFRKYEDFDKFNIIHLAEGKMKDKLKLSDNNIIIVSKQLLQEYVGDSTIKTIKNLKLDLIAFDENHYGGTTTNSENIIDSYSSKDTVKLFLTATYCKTIVKWRIPEDCQIYWSIEDEQNCKNSDIDKLIESHGPVVNEVIEEMKLEGYDLDHTLKLEYAKYPDLHILTTMFDQERWDSIETDVEKSVYGFSMESLFALHGKKKEFKYPNQITTVLQYISGDCKEKNFPDGDISMFARMNKIRAEFESRQSFTQLWFLPPNNVDTISKNLEELIKTDSILNKYEILIVNSKTKKELNVKNIKDDIEKKENAAKLNKKSGLIILAGCMLTLGITLSLCDVVVLLNDTVSSDRIMQMMYRCMTDSDKCDKKCGFVIDCNVGRVLQACMSYGSNQTGANIESKFRYVIDNHLINIDHDYLIGKKVNSNKIILKLLEIWKSNTLHKLHILLRNLEENKIILDNDDQKELNKLQFKNAKNKTNAIIEINKQAQNIKSGKEIIKEKKDESDEDENEDKKEIKNEPIVKIDISLTKDILPLIIPLACILTLNENSNDFCEMLNIITQNKELLETFNSQSYIWWSNPFVIDIVTKLVKKYVTKQKSEILDIAVVIKVELKSLIDRPKDLLKFISERLLPKECEKKKYGEVFTPMELVEVMLDKLDIEYTKQNKSSVFTNENLRWYDSSNGMGNFPIAVYLRLMNGLKLVIPDEKERKRHILENMLYMSELNKKNAFICKQIFDLENQYKLNLNCGNSLDLDVKTKWNIENFSIILGNPPFQKENTMTTKARGGKNSCLYLDFVANSLNLLAPNGYLVYIHPLNWRKVGSVELCKFLEKKLCYIGLNYGSQYFKQVSTKTDMYVLQNTPFNNKTTTIESYEKNKLISSCDVVIGKDTPFITSIVNTELWSILEKIKQYGKVYECILNSDCHKTRNHVNEGKTTKFCYPLYNTSGRPFDYFSSKPHKDQTTKKVLMSNSGKLVPFYDETHGTTQDSMYIIVSSEAEANAIIGTLNSKIFSVLIELCQWGNFRTEKQLISTFKYVDYEKVGKKSVDDTFVNNYFKLSKKEVEFIDTYFETNLAKKPKKEAELDSDSDSNNESDSNSESEDEKPIKKIKSKK